MAAIVLLTGAMHGVLHSIALFFLSLGGMGLLLLGVLDSSFLFMPFGNDLLIIALTASHPQRIYYYVPMAALGSVTGVAITAWISAKGGQKTIEKDGKSKRIAYLERKIQEKGGFALAFAALMPPPFPFTPFVIVAAALQYPRTRMLWIVAAGRVVRFAVEGSLAIVFGHQIIRIAQSSTFQGFVIALVVISIAGSAWSIFNWIRQSRKKG